LEDKSKKKMKRKDEKMSLPKKSQNILTGKQKNMV